MARAGLTGSRPGIARRAAFRTPRGRVRAVDQDGSVQVDQGALQGAVDGLLEDTTDAVATSYGETLIPLVERAQQLSPVDTGRLRDSWSLSYDQAGAVLLARVGNSAPYALYVRQGRSFRVARDLLWQPGQEAAEDLAGQISEFMTSVVGGR